MNPQDILALIVRVATFVAATALFWLALPYLLALLGALIALLAGYVTATVVTNRLFGDAAHISASFTSRLSTLKERFRG